MKTMRVCRKAVFLILWGAVLPWSLWAGEKSLPPVTPPAPSLFSPATKPITVEFLVYKKTEDGTGVYTGGKRGEVYSQQEELFFRFTNTTEGYVQLISVSNDGVFFFFPFEGGEKLAEGTHELLIRDKPQHFSLEKIRGDLFIIALLSLEKLDPEKEISPAFSDIKWLKDGKLDRANLATRIPGSEVDYFRIFVEKPKPQAPRSGL